MTHNFVKDVRSLKWTAYNGAGDQTAECGIFTLDIYLRPVFGNFGYRICGPWSVKKGKGTFALSLGFAETKEEAKERVLEDLLVVLSTQEYLKRQEEFETKEDTHALQWHYDALAHCKKAAFRLGFLNGATWARAFPDAKDIVKAANEVTEGIFFLVKEVVSRD